MKKKGTRNEYSKEFHEDLMNAYRKAYETSSPCETRSDIIRRAIHTPTQRFWTSERSACKAITLISKGKSLRFMRKNTREMYEEIYRRYVRKRHLYRTKYETIIAVCNEPAPQFYITEGSFVVIMHKIKKAWFAERQRKLLAL